MTAPVPAWPAAYIRVASAGTEHDLTVQHQQHAALRAAAERGWPPSALYTDAGVSGWQRPGPALTRLSDAISSSQHDAVITQDAARISRNPAHVEAFARHCADRGAALEFLHGGTLDPGTLALHSDITG